ncbi:MAG TPA: PIN domain-containing protein [Terracidiphilus sp.]|nr:PIN domain-containing protein [Terracidiphilus sp.]
MTGYVLDSSALLRYVDSEPGADRVESVLRECVRGSARGYISAVQWGEVAGRLYQKLAAPRALEVLSQLLPSEVEIVPATAERAVRAGIYKVEKKLGYADSFAYELASESHKRVLVTADYGFEPISNFIRIEFLPTK